MRAPRIAPIRGIASRTRNLMARSPAGQAIEAMVDPDAASSAAPAGPSDGLVAAAVYRDGERVFSSDSLAATYRQLDQLDHAMAWIGLYRPAESQILSLAEEFGLHHLAVEDAIVAHQRPKLERYGDTLLVVLRAARYLDAAEEVEFGELHVFIGDNFAVTVRHAESPDLSHVRARMEAEPELLTRGSEAVLYAILDAVVDEYGPVVAGLANDIDEIETQVFDGDPEVSRRIYKLSREVIDFERATHPLPAMIAALVAGFDKYEIDDELRRNLRDVADHVTQVNDRVGSFRLALRDMLTVNATLVAQRQNEEMKALSEASFAQNDDVKKISSWAAVLFAPTLIGTIYGMNFTAMPELRWTLGYPLALLMMVGVSATLYLVFRKRGWL
ncbi:MAG: magnesium and cobalt transport protein CorA [Frankiaceae bacterium]|jgi:magnesium transporter|nr:magnesium and cobalt transport protein CorA [Frankiaceae bacterium]